MFLFFQKKISSEFCEVFVLIPSSIQKFEILQYFFPFLVHCAMLDKNQRLKDI